VPYNPMSIITHKKTNRKVLKINKKSYDYKRLMKCVLSFLQKLVNEMRSVAFQSKARPPTNRTFVPVTFTLTR